MVTTILELKPNRDLLNPQFDGYKLSLQDITVTKTKSNKLHRVENKSYDYKHQKLYGLQNFLFSESINGSDFVYFIDADGNVNKFSLEAFGFRLSEKQEVFKFTPENIYNSSLKFASDNIAVISNGGSNLYILETKSRGEDHKWCELASVKFDFNFIILTCDLSHELNCLLYRLGDNGTDSSLFWVVLDKTWGIKSKVELKSKGELYHVGLNSEKLLIASEKTFLERNVPAVKKYEWGQTDSEIYLKLKIGDESFDVKTIGEEISIKVGNEIAVKGKLYGSIKVEMTTSVRNEGVLDVKLVKTEMGASWPEFIPGDATGVYIVDEATAEEVHQRLSHLCSENEILSSNSSILNTDEMEECDFPKSNSGLMEFITPELEITHRVHLASHPILFNLRTNNSDALVVQQNEDACVWVANFSPDTNFEHAGTLPAFGYVQASKQRRKFCGCSPDFSYAVVIELDRHIFVYRQNKLIDGGELRNRGTGKRVQQIAQQQVITLDDGEIHGFYCSNTTMFILTDNYLYAYQMS